MSARKSGFVILDLDNCVADDAHRIPRIDWRTNNMFKRYHDYHSLGAFDRAGPLAGSELVKESNVVVFTGRPVHYRAATEHWLSEVAGIEPHTLIMRNDADHRPSVTIKSEMLNWLMDLYNVALGDIIIAYDDRPDIVAMYRAEGLRAEVHAIHNVCAYTNPATGVDRG